MAGRSRPKENVGERLVELADETPGIPERLLLAHSRGEVVFVAGAGVSQPSQMPDFRTLVLQVELMPQTYCSSSFVKFRVKKLRHRPIFLIARLLHS